VGDLLRRIKPTRRAVSTTDEPASSTAPPETGADAPAATESARPTAYRTFSRKLAPSLTALGSLLAIAGGVGVWVRATEVTTEGLAPTQVATIMGYESWPGVAIAVLGGLAFLGSVAWLLNLLLLKALPVLYSIGIAALVAWQLPQIDRDAAALAEAARDNIDFVAFHAGYGWGAWCMLGGAVLVVLGSIAGILREIDVRRGIPG
jgi:hypothetical protein